jgi:hypothetical protein
MTAGAREPIIGDVDMPLWMARHVYAVVFRGLSSDQR